MARKREFNQTQVDEWLRRSEALRREMISFGEDLEKFLTKRHDPVKILGGMIKEAASLVSCFEPHPPPPPVNEKIRRFAAYGLPATECMWCGAPSHYHLTQRMNSQLLKLAFCDRCSQWYLGIGLDAFLDEFEERRRLQG